MRAKLEWAIAAVAFVGTLAAFSPAFSDSGTPSKVDQTSLAVIAQYSQSEMAFAQFALDRSSNDNVRRFAARVVDEHGKIDDPLGEVYRYQSGISYPTDVNAAQQTILDRISKLSGAEFDVEYAKGVVREHERAVLAIEAACGAEDEQIRGLAKAVLPIVKERLELARKLP